MINARVINDTAVMSAPRRNEQNLFKKSVVQVDSESAHYMWKLS